MVEEIYSTHTPSLNLDPNDPKVMTENCELVTIWAGRKGVTRNCYRQGSSKYRIIF